MYTDAEVRRHSPGMWALYGAAWAAALVTTYTAAVNVWEYRSEIRTWLKL